MLVPLLSFQPGTFPLRILTQLEQTLLRLTLVSRKIRYWEEKGLIESENEGEGTTRRYNYLNIKKILLIQELIEEGYTLDAAAKKVEDRMKNINDVFLKLANTASNQNRY
ncbi:MerR family transcriptional regulator [Bacillus canaveralius]|nr:MerR family transcriptional regulator [Bacillus canaveralius]